jgi:hypothetical protein
MGPSTRLGRDMQWYVYLITIPAVFLLVQIAVELFGHTLCRVALNATSGRWQVQRGVLQKNLNPSLAVLPRFWISFGSTEPFGLSRT